MVTWIGTCLNPADGRHYAISYNDCCGKSSCGRCFCNRNERDMPLHIPFLANDYNWCSGSTNANVPYHCSMARVVGEVDQSAAHVSFTRRGREPLSRLCDTGRAGDGLPAFRA